MPRSWGPNWAYVLTLFMAHLEYFLWPLEINSYLFKENDVKIALLHNPSNIDRWRSKTKTWGSVFSSLGFGVGTVNVTLEQQTL